MIDKRRDEKMGTPRKTVRLKVRRRRFASKRHWALVVAGKTWWR